MEDCVSALTATKQKRIQRGRYNPSCDPSYRVAREQLTRGRSNESTQAATAQAEARPAKSSPQDDDRPGCLNSEAPGRASHRSEHRGSNGPLGISTRPISGDVLSVQPAAGGNLSANAGVW